MPIPPGAENPAVVEPVATDAARPDLSLVVVAYHSARDLAGLLRSFRCEVAAMGQRAEVIVVEHSEDEHEADAVRALGLDVVLERPNRGYAAGINAGAGAARGHILLLANPDLELAEGSLKAMLDALNKGFSVVGPQFVLDRGGTVFLAPPEDPSPRAEAWRAARRRWAWAWRRGLEHEIRQATRIWQASEPVDVVSLRGSLLAMRREDWNRLGGFDEQYFLYYEETDWLWRARLAGARLGIAPDARVVHRWGHSTWRHRDLEVIEESSRRRFRDRHYGRFWCALLAFFEGRTTSIGVDVIPVDGPGELPLQPDILYVLSPFPHLMPPLGWFGDLPDRTALDALVGQWVVAEARRVAKGWTLGRAWTWRGEGNGSSGVRAGGAMS